jgi:hypothetical protein
VAHTAILIVDGYDVAGYWGPYQAEEARRFPWLELCLRRIEKHTAETDYEVLVYNNTGPVDTTRSVAGHPLARYVTTYGRQPHPVALDILVASLATDTEYIVTLDTDAFPICDGWLDRLHDDIACGATLAGVWRDEMAPILQPFVHVSCLCVRQRSLHALNCSFSRGMGQDVGQNLSHEVLGRGDRVAPWRRSNAQQAHYLMGGLYADMVYHHGAGSRRAQFWTSIDPTDEERIRVTLRDLVFSDLADLIAILRGERPGDPRLAWTSVDSARHGLAQGKGQAPYGAASRELHTASTAAKRLVTRSEM